MEKSPGCRCEGLSASSARARLAATPPRPAEQRDEFASLHSITSSARAPSRDAYLASASWTFSIGRFRGFYRALPARMRELGHVDGRNIHVEYHPPSSAATCRHARHRLGGARSTYRRHSDSAATLQAQRQRSPSAGLGSLATGCKPRAAGRELTGSRARSALVSRKRPMEKSPGCRCEVGVPTPAPAPPSATPPPPSRAA